MSKTGAWVLAMQEDASEMSLEEFCSEWGHSHSEVWEEVQQELQEAQLVQQLLSGPLVQVQGPGRLMRVRGSGPLTATARSTPNTG